MAWDQEAAANFAMYLRLVSAQLAKAVPAATIAAPVRGCLWMSIGPVMLDLEGPFLTARERTLLAHPQVGGVILFTRNFESFAQLTALTNELMRLREPPLLIA